MKPQDTTACAKGRWEGIGGVVPDKDPWANCRQYQPTQTKTIKKSINKSIKKTMNWIEVEDNPPKEGGRYIVWLVTPYGGGFSDAATLWNGAWYQNRSIANPFVADVTHYMPLPVEPPKP